jgi:hypothetical protein
MTIRLRNQDLKRVGQTEKVNIRVDFKICKYCTCFTHSAWTGKATMAVMHTNIPAFQHHHESHYVHGSSDLLAAQSGV